MPALMISKQILNFLNRPDSLPDLTAIGQMPFLILHEHIGGNMGGAARQFTVGVRIVFSIRNSHWGYKQGD